MVFPQRLHPPESVNQARIERRLHIFKTVVWGVAIRGIIVLFEFFGAYIFKSASLFMDALSSSLDVISSLLLLLFIKLAERPPDSNHPFGHGRYEPLAGLQLSIVLIVLGGAMFFRQIFVLTTVPQGVIDPRAWIISLGALILLELGYYIVMTTAKKHNSPALAADAIHYRIDSLSSLFATVALLLAAFLPSWSHVMDHIGAIAIALFMIGMGAYAVRKNLNQLLDTVPDEKYFDIVRKAAKKVPGVHDTEKLRIQLYGPDAHVDIDIEVDPLLPVEKAHLISQQVRVAIQQDWPQVRDVIVHIEPYYPGDH